VTLTRRGIARFGEKKFSAKAHHSSETICGKLISSRCAHIRASTEATTYSSSSMLSAWAVPLKSKGGSEMADAIAEIIWANGRCPKNKRMGKEWGNNTDVQEITTWKNTTLITIPRIRLKASVIERFNHTFENDMWKMFTLDGNYKWIDDPPT